jgi:hypothetical protein
VLVNIIITETNKLSVFLTDEKEPEDSLSGHGVLHIVLHGTCLSPTTPSRN